MAIVIIQNHYLQSLFTAQTNLRINGRKNSDLYSILISYFSHSSSAYDII